MITGLSYLFASLVIGLLLVWASKSSHQASGENKVFAYPSPVRWALLAGIFFWIIAAAAVTLTKRPGIDSTTTIGICVIFFVFLTIGNGFVYALTKRFFLAIDKTAITYRKLGDPVRIDFSQLDCIEFTSDRIIVYANKKKILVLSYLIQDVEKLKLLLQMRGRKIGVRIEGPQFVRPESV